MTMPHLMNCNHSEDGWCLGCVKELHHENEMMQHAVDLLKQLDGFLDFDVEWVAGEIFTDPSGINEVQKKCRAFIDSIDRKESTQ